MPRSGPTMQGSFRLFELAGITVYMHWSWAIVAVFMLQQPFENYHARVWNLVEYLSLFAIVLMHEFGHALACRQVGGRADEIVLWPLGGVAFVQPPPRPGAWLWSIVAGPLVNVILVPVTFIAYAMVARDEASDLKTFVGSLVKINLVLLIFNLLPIYPLDGGKILQSLLWFVIGRAKSLMVAAIIGLTAVVLFVGMLLVGVVFSGPGVIWHNIWLWIIALFAASQCFAGLREAQFLAKLERTPRHKEASCPSCRAHPIAGNFWTCDQCHMHFDTFECHGQCPRCAQRFSVTTCPECGEASPIAAWFDPWGYADQELRDDRL